MSELNANQIKAIEALLAGATRVRAAEVAGVTDRTIRKWLQNDRFRNALRDGQRQLFDHAVRKLVCLADEITIVQRSIMLDPLTPANVRLRASQLLRDGLFRGLELRELTDATEIIEGWANGDEGQGKTDGGGNSDGTEKPGKPPTWLDYSRNA